ncbi:hypothetical protein FOA43_000486 [Brettanomyces nanus]|uniref:Major facilitator superfamily (MFS) profile domain-containing protein n=1 Tax=Eeniella nana TaxID=13502 RepID=A0A875RN52_EENNA|nr:uncharacterized protein FOA43_000486 [Brettanomyces nanus]QPG73180.1 hypothetical protein FOA43_000486 [Brettanomyces nanus]
MNNSKPEILHAEYQEEVCEQDNIQGKNKVESDLYNFDTSVLADLDEIPTYLKVSGNKLQLMATLMGSVGFCLFGYDQGVMGSLLTLPSFRDTFPSIDTVTHPDTHTSTIQGFVIAVYEIGCLFGALVNLRLSDKYGRLKSIFLGCALMAIGAAIQCSSFTIGQFVVGRVITGLGNGLNTSSIPVYESETVRADVRGKLVMLFGAVNTGGVALSYWLDFAFYFIHSSVSFRFPIAFQILFPVLILPMLPFLPESPRWLSKHGRFREAAKVFAAFEGTSINDPIVLGEIDRVRQSLIEEKEAGKGLSMRKALFSQGKHRNFHRMMLGLCSQILQQLTGINLVTYYAGTIFESYIGMSALNSRIMAACNGTEYFFFSFVPFFTIEKYGRRALMMIGSVFECFSMTMLTVFTELARQGHNKTSMGIGATVMLFVFNSAFAFGWLAMTWLLPAELTPLSIRAPANAITTAGNWSFNFMVVMITPIAFNNIHSYTYTIFAIFNFLTIPIIYFMYPETKGRTLEEMDEIFGQCPIKEPWKVVGIAKRTPYEARRYINIETSTIDSSSKSNSEAEKDIVV